MIDPYYLQFCGPSKSLGGQNSLGPDGTEPMRVKARSKTNSRMNRYKITLGPALTVLPSMNVKNVLFDLRHAPSIKYKY